jgi:hypothetical protein
VLLAWLARRKAAVAAALAAGAATAYDGFSPAFASWRDTPPVQTVAVLLSLAALAVLAVAAGRPPRLWLWLVGPAAAAPVLAQLPDAIPSATFLVSALPWATMFLVAVSIAWIGADARPAMGLAVYLALLGLPNLAAVVDIGGGLQMALAELPWLELAIVLAVPALWRLRRQAVL